MMCRHKKQKIKEENGRAPAKQDGATAKLREGGDASAQKNKKKGGEGTRHKDGCAYPDLKVMASLRSQRSRIADTLSNVMRFRGSKAQHCSMIS